MATDVQIGTTLACVTGLDPLGKLVSGRRAILEAVARRWGTPRGRLGYDPNYGYCVADCLNDDVDARGIAAIRSGMSTEALKDERVLSCSIAVTVPQDETGSYVFRAALADADGPFDGTFTLDAAGVLKVIALNNEVIS